MKIICYDFEIFRFDSLLGALIVENNEERIFQSWDPKEIKQFYYDNIKDAIWVSHNGFHYDQLIYQEILRDKNPYQMSKDIVNGDVKSRSNLEMSEFDCMTIRRTPFSLKITELISGKNIHTTDVDFDINRKLTDEEKELTEGYNKDDLKQTLYNFQKFYPQFKLRLDIGLTFDIPVKEALKLTEAQLAAKVLGAKRDPSLKYKPIEPILWDNLRLKNQNVIDFYLNREYEHKNLNIKVCGTEHTLGKGGIHAALNKVYYKKVLYFDVGGYYNSIMIQLDLFPRTMDQASKQKYIDMFQQQLAMKKDPSKKNARKAYKTILLSVFGAMNNEYSDFYDPYKFILVTLSGQLFLVDLLEKLEGLVDLVQSNTDGICIYPHNWEDEEKIDKIVEEWENRTGFKMEKEYLYDLYQRDVNCYFAIEEDGNVHYKGNSLINYKVDDESYGACRLFDATEPPIMAKGIIDFFLYEIDPEETVEKNKKDLRLFQYPCKKGTYDYITEDKYAFITNNKGKQEAKLYNSKVVKPLNRVFAKRVELINGLKTYTILTKHKDNHGKHQKAKIANLPDSVFIYNEDISNAYEVIKDQIDYNYYVNRIYEKLGEFINLDDIIDSNKNEKDGSKQLSFDL